MAKHIIAAILQNPTHKVKRDSLLLEYHNLRQIFINANKYILSEEQEQTTTIESDHYPSSVTGHSREQIDNARRTLAVLATEENQATAGRDFDDGSHDDEAEANDSYEA